MPNAAGGCNEECLGKAILLQRLRILRDKCMKYCTLNRRHNFHSEQVGTEKTVALLTKAIDAGLSRDASLEEWILARLPPNEQQEWKALGGMETEIEFLFDTCLAAARLSGEGNYVVRLKQIFDLWLLAMSDTQEFQFDSPTCDIDLRLEIEEFIGILEQEFDLRWPQFLIRYAKPINALTRLESIPLIDVMLKLINGQDSVNSVLSSEPNKDSLPQHSRNELDRRINELPGIPADDKKVLKLVVAYAFETHYPRKELMSLIGYESSDHAFRTYLRQLAKYWGSKLDIAIVTSNAKHVKVQVLSALQESTSSEANA